MRRRALPVASVFGVALLDPLALALFRGLRCNPQFLSACFPPVRFALAFRFVFVGFAPGRGMSLVGLTFPRSPTARSSPSGMWIVSPCFGMISPLGALYPLSVLTD
jgi:hypothetical protein